MQDVFTIISDLTVIIFDLLIYFRLTPLRRDTRGMHFFLAGCCVLITAVCFTAIYVFKMPASSASFLCMSLPSFLLFFCVSKHKGARFIVTFCFVDTITLIIACLARALGIYLGAWGALAGCVCTFVLFLTVYITGRPYFPQYRKLLDSVKDGWLPMMFSTLLIYLLLVVSAAYPKPLAARLEYMPGYLLLCAAIVSFYAVFLLTLIQKKRLNDLNEQLTNEKKWHHIAYVDGLTQLGNRMAYIERINALSRSTEEHDIYAVMLDLNDFKAVNDTWGHHMGDTMLQKAAERLNEVFAGESYELFRIGGDEFAIIALGDVESALTAKLNSLSITGEKLNCTFSYGCAKVDMAENNAMENAFIRADTAMYRYKRAIKAES